MRCPRCRNDGQQVERVVTGSKKLDYILACWSCSWQIAVRDLDAWIKRWTR